MTQQTSGFLLIDAAQDWRRRLARLLELGGHIVAAPPSLDADAAAAELARGSVDCLLLDPADQDPAAVADLLNAARQEQARVVLLGVDAAQAAELGVTEFVPKPYPKPSEMLDRLRLGTGAAASPPATDSPELHMLRERCKDLEVRLGDQTRALAEARDAFNQDLSRMMNIISNMMDGILFLDAEGNITQLNPVAEEMLELRAFMVVGQNLFDLEVGGELLEAIRSACETSPDWRESCKTVEVHQDDQDLLYVKMRIGRVVDYRGQAAGTLIQLEDVTSEYKTDQLKNQYLSIVAHELRTPLTGIKTFSTMLTKGALGDLNDKQSRVMESIREQSLRLEHQIDKLVNLGHLDSTDVGQDLATVDMGDLVAQSVVPFATVADEKRVELICDVPPTGEAVVDCDKAAVRRAIQALVENAVKFAAQGGHVRVSVASVETGVEVAVEDDGCGVDVRYQRRIFEKFFQVEDPLTRHHGGSGLGLFFVKSILEAHQSTVTVRSSLGNGARFSFCLPSRIGLAADEVTATPSHNAHAAPNAD